MNSHKINLHNANPTSFLFAGLVSVVLLATTPSTFAATNDAAAENAAPETTYVDSVKKWGAWGLRIEPAAGGIQKPSTQPLKSRDTKLTLRTNSISALAPTRLSAGVSPIIPVAPVIPTITPINPSVPIPVGTGGSNDGL